MALSDPSIQGIERLDSNQASKKLPIPLEVNIGGRNLKITDYNELFDLNKINGNSRRITTLTIKTVSTYKQKVGSNNEIEQQKSPQISYGELLNEPSINQVNSQLYNKMNNQLNNQERNLKNYSNQRVVQSNRLNECNKDYEFNRESSVSSSKLNNINNNKFNDKENQFSQAQVVKSEDLLNDDLIKNDYKARRTTDSTNEQRKIKQITIEKSIQVDPKLKLRINDDHQLNNRTYSSKTTDDSFFRNSKRTSSLRQLNLFTKYGNSDLKSSSTDQQQQQQQQQSQQNLTKYFVSDKFDSTSPNRLTSTNDQMTDQTKKTSNNNEQKGKFFYFNGGKSNQMLYKDEIDNLNLINQKSNPTSVIDDKFKKHLNASLNSSFNQKDGNNNSNLKTNQLINNRTTNTGSSNYLQSSTKQYGQSNFQTQPYNSQQYISSSISQHQPTKQLNQFNYLEQYHHQPNQQGNNSFMRKKQPMIRKLSAGGSNVDEINCDEFVSELKTKIANNNQTTSSPATGVKLNNFNSNTLDKERTRHLILDTSTMPHLGRTKQVQTIGNNLQNQKKRSNLTSSIRRNESFQRATEQRIQMEPVKRSTKDNLQINKSIPETMDKFDSATINQPNNIKNEQRFSYLGSQAVNGYQPENYNRQSNDNLANETCTTDDWNTTIDTNIETRSTTDDRSRQFKKCDKYGFFINENEQKNKTGSIKKEDEQTKKTNLEIDKRREMKWLEMLNNWDRYMQKRWNKICERCRKGIPPALRGKAWFYLCAAHKQKRHKEDLFHFLNQKPGNESINDEIIKDLHRQFPNHEMFAGANSTTGQQDLFTVLKNFSILKPEIAYCQGEAPIASVLLMHLPVEDAFFALVQLCDHYLNGYFTPGLETIQMHGRMLTSLLKRQNNYVYKVLKKQKIDSTMYMTEWFMCVFARTLPWPTVLRVWDMFFCEGIKIVFRVALVILNSIEPDLRRAKCNSNDKLAETMEVLKNLPKKYLEIDYLLPKVIEMNLSEKDLEAEHYNILKKMKKKK